MLLIWSKSMILNGQCLRLADNNIKCVDVDINDIANSIKQPFMAEPLENLIDDAKNILFILSPDINEKVYDYFINHKKFLNNDK